IQFFFNYGSASASFILSDLNFMEPVKKLTSLNYAKLRGSYATTGKGSLNPYIIDLVYQSVITIGGGYVLGFTANNYNLRPELSKNLEIGGEFKFLHNRIGVDIAWFNNKVKDNIIQQRISYGTGGILRWVN